MILCRYCHAVIGELDDFCSNCGLVIATGERGIKAHKLVLASNIPGSSNLEHYANAIACLQPIAASDSDAFLLLVWAVRNHYDGVRPLAADALGEIADQRAVPCLIDALDDPYQRVRVASMAALKKMGPSASAAVPRLVNLLKASDPLERMGAASALGNIRDRAAVPALIKALTRKHKYNADREYQSTMYVQPANRLSYDYYQSSHVAATALGIIGDTKAVPALVKCLNAHNQYLRRSASEALGKICGPEHIPILLKALKDRRNQVREGATVALGGIGPSAQAAVPALIQALKDREPSVRESAARALGSIGDPAAVTALVDALADTNHLLRVWSAHALGTIGPSAQAAVPALIKALRDSDNLVRRDAARALGRIGSDSAVSMLISTAIDTDYYVSEEALKALRLLGSEAMEALLVRVLRDLYHAKYGSEWQDLIYSALDNKLNDLYFRISKRFDDSNEIRLLSEFMYILNGIYNDICLHRYLRERTWSSKLPAVLSSSARQWAHDGLARLSEFEEGTMTWPQESLLIDVLRDESLRGILPSVLRKMRDDVDKRALLEMVKGILLKNNMREALDYLYLE